MVETVNTILYPAGAKLLVGRFYQANPNVILIFSPQKLTECTFHGNLRRRE